MLKVTSSSHDGGASTFKFEGKLIEPWVGEVQRLIDEGQLESGSQLDLTRLTFVDHAGLRLLRTLLGNGIRISSCSPYVAELLRTHSFQC